MISSPWWLCAQTGNVAVWESVLSHGDLAWWHYCQHVLQVGVVWLPFSKVKLAALRQALALQLCQCTLLRQHCSC